MRRGLAALLSVLLVAAAVGPVALVSSLWVGPALTATAIARGNGPAQVDYAVVGACIAATAIPGVVLLCCVPGLLRGRRTTLPWALAAAAIVTLAGIAPLASTAPAWGLPLGRVVILGLGVAALIAMLVSPRDPSARHGRVWIPVTAVALVIAAAATVGATGTGIPDGPLTRLLPRGDVARAAGEPMDVTPAGGNPHLAAGEGSTIHNDAWMTDTYAQRRTLDPATGEVRSFFAGGDCATILFDADGRLVTTCVALRGVTAYVIDPTTLEPLASRVIDERPLTRESLTDFSGGGYAILDSRQRLVVPLRGGIIGVFSTSVRGRPAIEPAFAYDVSAALAPGEQITSVVPDWTGPLWFVGQHGTVGLVDPASGRARSIRLGADIGNSFAVAAGGGAYVVTTRELAFLAIGDRMTPVVRWSAGYDAGERVKPGQTGQGSGTTPTVMLDGRYVAIADNADPRMGVVVYDAAPGAADRRLCRVEVFPAGEGATENSLVAAGPALFVENNYGYGPFQVVGGRTTRPGVARIDVDPGARTCTLAWENRVVHVPSAVSKVSAPDGVFLSYVKEPSAIGIEAWSFAALDAYTGELLWTRLAGTGPMLNNHYAGVYVGDSGAIYAGTISGIVALVPR